MFYSHCFQLFTLWYQMESTASFLKNAKHKGKSQ